MVKAKVIEKIQRVKYFSLIADVTPDCSHQEQISVVIRFVELQEKSIEMCERFLCFESFTDKTGKGIANRLLQSLSKNRINFENCVGGSFDNAANMSGCKNGVQAWLKAENSNFIFSPCGKNLVGNDVVASKASSILEISKYFSIFSAHLRSDGKLFLVMSVNLFIQSLKHDGMQESMQLSQYAHQWTRSNQHSLKFTTN